MALTVGELVAFLRLDKGQYDRGLAEGKNEARVAGREIGRSLSVDVDTSNLQRYAQRIRDLRVLYSSSIKPVRDYSAQVGGLAIKAGAASTALGGGIGLLGVVSSLIFSLGSIGAALPVVAVGLLGVAAVSRTAKIALAGVGDALDDKIGDAFDKISPKAQSFVDEFGELVPTLAKVKNAIQDSLFDDLAGTLGPLAERYLPLLTRNGSLLAGALNGAALIAAQGLLDPKTVTSLNTVLGKLAGILEDFSPALRGVIPLLAQVLLAGIPGLERLGDKASGVVERFKKALGAGLQSGGLERAITGGLNAAATLGGVLADVVVILFKVGQAAHEAFGNPLGELHDLTDGVRQWVSSARGQETITAVFRLFAPVLAGIGDVLQLLAPEVLSLLPLIQALAVTFLTGLKPVVPVLGDLVRTIGEGLISVLPVVSKFAVVLGGFLVEALDLLVPLIPPLGDALVALLGPTGLLTGILAALQPVLVPLAEGLAMVVSALAGGLLTVVEALAPTLPGLVSAIVLLAVTVADSLAASLEQIAPLLPQIVTAFTDLLVALIPLVPEILALIPPLVQFLVDAGIPLLELMIRLAPGIIIVANTLVGLAAAALSILGPLTGFAVKVIGAFSAWLGNGGIPDIIFRVSAWIVGLPGRISGVPGQMLRLAVGMIASFLAGLTGRWGDVAAFFGTIAGRISSAVGDLSGVLLGAGGQIIGGLVQGIRDSLPSLTGVLGAVTSMIPRLKGPPEKDRRLLDPAGHSIIRGLVGGIEDEVPTLRAALEGITHLIPADAASLSLQGNREAAAALAARAVPPPPADRPGQAVAELGDVHVYIGDQEITDMIRVEVAASGRSTASAAYAGAGRRAG